MPFANSSYTGAGLYFNVGRFRGKTESLTVSFLGGPLGKVCGEAIPLGNEAKARLS
jgi:hypothetical protein